MVDVLAVPFRVRGGRVERMTHGSDAEHLTLIRVLAETRVGERLLVPGFGLGDYAFSGGFDVAALSAAMELYGPARTVVSSTVESADDDVLRIRLEVD